MQTNKLNRKSLIVAQVIISESELAKVIPNYDASMETKRKYWFRSILYDLGIDTNQSYLRQDAIWHRNRFGEVVFCSRWLGEERLDTEWLESGYASQAAIDKASGSRLIESLYREKGLTEDVQNMLEERDQRSKLVEGNT